MVRCEVKQRGLRGSFGVSISRVTVHNNAVDDPGDARNLGDEGLCKLLEVIPFNLTGEREHAVREVTAYSP